ncbi:hypothetical protein D047_1642B, partial [Vibrio parahaemolyticus VPTS-2010_2]
VKRTVARMKGKIRQVDVCGRGNLRKC